MIESTSNGSDSVNILVTPSPSNVFDFMTTCCGGAQLELTAQLDVPKYPTPLEIELLKNDAETKLRAIKLPETCTLPDDIIPLRAINSFAIYYPSIFV